MTLPVLLLLGSCVQSSGLLLGPVPVYPIGAPNAVVECLIGRGMDRISGLQVRALADASGISVEFRTVTPRGHPAYERDLAVCTKTKQANELVDQAMKVRDLSANLLAVNPPVEYQYFFTYPPGFMSIPGRSIALEQSFCPSLRQVLRSKLYRRICGLPGPQRVAIVPRSWLSTGKTHVAHDLFFQFASKKGLRVYRFQVIGASVTFSGRITQMPDKFIPGPRGIDAFGSWPPR